MKVYISGPISDQANPRPAFDSAASALRAAGFDVVNPYDLDHSTHGRAWADFMAQDLGMMLAPMSLFLTMKAAA